MARNNDKHQNSDSNNTNNRLTQSLTTSDNISSLIDIFIETDISYEKNSTLFLFLPAAVILCDRK
jgi:hypothetical protein